MKHELTLYCEKNKLSELRTFLDRVLNASQLSDINKNQLILAVEEVCANLIIHSHDCNPRDFIKLKVNQLDQSIIFEIMDSGEAFNMTEYNEPDLKEVIKKRRKGGLGIKLVRKIMDTIEFESSENQNICRLIKQLKSK
ncbi:ATP-binding protein [Echinicola jeungdonensis]|uniref:ATP-binding protein n=1 Tax=Echinicola jeungdonensis TaxID=709343 RepID=A0ABV5J3E5_9BACT|nr:ATP-binding protein [Echinicola jeungdonensis]MDN3668592.1 ATP-binding protein [Echinicola jeungdonensis]